MKQTLTIRYATEADNSRLADFRISQFKTAKEFELLTPSLLEQQKGYVFIVEKGDEIISTMQIETAHDHESFQAICHATYPKEWLSFSALYLSKGATLKEYRNFGLNSYIRKLVIEDALKDGVVHSITGVAYENAPRLHLLEKLGYQSAEVELLNKSFTKPLGKVLFVSLDRRQFEHAHQLLVQETKEIESEFNIVNKTLVPTRS